MMSFVFKNEKLCIQNEELCITYDEIFSAGTAAGITKVTVFLYSNRWILH